METITLTITNDLLIKMKDFYEDFIEENDNPHLEFFARLDDCTISVYKSMKAVFQGLEAKEEASIWQLIPESSWLITESHIGSDEVGTGDYFGPVCVAAVYVKSDDIDWLNGLGVADSKKISDEKILEIAPLLIKRLPYSQMAVDNPKFNDLTAKGYNMNKIKAILHNAVLNNVKNKVNNQNIKIVVDQFAEEKLYYSYLINESIIVNNITFMTKAESHAPAVAAASIIARYSFLKKMEEISKKYNITIPKGAGMVVDTFGELFIKLYGMEELTKITKLNFKNTSKIIELLNRFKV